LLKKQEIFGFLPLFLYGLLNLFFLFFCNSYRKFQIFFSNFCNFNYRPWFNF
jgi:hypothetical protein